MHLDLFKPDDVRRALGDDSEDDLGYGLSPADTPEAVRRRALKTILADPRGGRREVVVGSAAILKRLNAIVDRAPHLREALGVVQRATTLSLTAHTPVSFIPTLLVGPAGVGKTWAVEQIARAFGRNMPLARYSFASGDDSNAALTGRSLVWRSSRAGGVANLLLGEQSIGNPLYFLDEIDKAAPWRDEDPLDPLHALLDRENARVFSDAYLEFPMRADLVNWIMTANTIKGLRPSLVDRMVVVHVDAPSAAQQRGVLQSIAGDVLHPFRRALQPAVSDAVVDCLAECPPRQARKLLELAAGFATSAGRRALAIDDIKAARALGTQHKQVIGFGRPSGR